MTNIDQLLMALGYCVFMLVLSLVFLKFPPSKINSTYGYRTKHSMKNQQIWDAANIYWTSLFFKCNLVSIAVPIVFYFIYPGQNLLITVIIHTLLVLITIPATKYHLEKKFDKEGNIS